MRSELSESLRRNQRQWDALGRHDPRWAVLSDNSRRGGRWDTTEFYATGNAFVELVLDRIGPDLTRRERALDFGCGVGRLTEALGRHFARTDGVDIAPSMIEAAEANSTNPQVTYQLNEAADLALFPENTFDLVLSFITLQHMPTHLALRYVREFGRVARPGGVVVFQAPYTEANLGWRSRVDRALPWLGLAYRRLRYGAAVRSEVFTHDAAEVVGTLTSGGLDVVHLEPGRLGDCGGWVSALYVARKRA